MLEDLNNLIRKPLNLLPWRIEGKLLSLLIVFVIGALVPFLAYKYYDLSLHQARVLSVALIAIGLWITEAVPSFAVSLGIVACQVFLLEDAQVRGTEAAFASHTQAWSSAVIWLMLGGFALSLGLSITALDRKLAVRILAISQGKAWAFLALLMIVTATLSMFMSNTATTALLVSIVSPILHNPTLDRSVVRVVLLSIASAATIGGLGTVIGSSPNALAMGYFSDQGIKFSFVDWLLIGLPAVILILIPVYFLLIKQVNKFMPVQLGLGDIEPENAVNLSRDDEGRLLWQQRIVIFTFLLTVFLWMTSPLHSWSIAAIAFIPLVVFSVAGIVRDQHIRQLPWDTLLFVMGGIVLGESVADSGLPESLVNLMQLDNLPMPILLLTLAYLTMFMSNFLSNTATAALLIPLVSVLLPSHQQLGVLIIALSASTALLLPISTPTNAVVYSTGLLSQRDFRNIGVLVGLLAPLIIVLICMFRLGL